MLSRVDQYELDASNEEVLELMRRAGFRRVRAEALTFGLVTIIGAVTVLIGGLPAARVGDMAVCVGPPDVIALGSFTVLTMSMPQARIGDLTAHGGTIVLGLPTVLVG